MPVLGKVVEPENRDGIADGVETHAR